MRSVFAFILLATLGADAFAAPVERPVGPGVRRVYLRAETADARQRVAPFVTHEYPGGILRAAVPEGASASLLAAPGLVEIGPEIVYHPLPIEGTEVGDRIAQPSAAQGTRCLPPGYTSPVGWGIRAMYADPNLARPSGGAGVKVAVLDGGVFPHPDLERRIARCLNLTPFNDIPPCDEQTLHGTQVASLIAADGGADGLGMWGMAPEAWIYSYRVCEPDGNCPGGYVAAGIYAAIEDGVNIINLSIAGSGHDEAVLAAVRAAVARNILVVAAAGNYPYSYMGYPAVHPEVLSVGAIQQDPRNPQNLIAWPYSAPGLNDGDYVREWKEIDVAAPGLRVLTALRTGCYWEGGGTSLAAPHVAGLAARLWNGDALATRRRIERAALFRDMHEVGDDPATGRGLPTVEEYGGVAAIFASAGPGGAVSPLGVAPVAHGASRTFTIAPASECQRIVDVVVDGVSQGPITSYTFEGVTSDHTLRATFAPVATYAIAASASPGGIITPVGATTVPCGGSQTYVITPAPGCASIEDVKVDGVSRGPLASYTFTDVRADHGIEVTFARSGVFTINTSTFPSGPTYGAISPSGPITMACGDSKTFTITESECGQLFGVFVDNVNQGRVSTFTFTNLSANHTIEARYTSRLVTIAASAGPGGSISPGGMRSVPCGSSIVHSIIPAPCHRIKDVKVDGESRGPIPAYTFANVSASHTIEASFEPATFTIVASPGAGGTILPTGTTTVACGGAQTYTIQPTHDCYSIQNVRVNGVNLGVIDRYTFGNVMANFTISATFKLRGPFPITASADPGGTISPGGTINVPCGGSQTYTISPAVCQRITDVQVNNVSQGPIATYTFTNVTSARSIQARFAAQGPYTIQATAGPGGTIRPGTTTVPCAGSATFSIAPADACHRIADVKVNGVSQGPIATYTFADVMGGQVIDATFAPIVYAIQAGAGPGGTITPSGTTSAACGGSLTYAIAPADKCHVIQDVTVDGVSQGPIAGYTFGDVARDHAIQATFSGLGPFTIAASAGPGATIIPAGETRVSCGESRGYSIAPADPCRVIADVRVDGVSVGAVSGYTFPDVQGPHTIEVISSPSSLTLAETHRGASWSGLADGAIDLSVTGGVPPYTFDWSNGATSEDVAQLAAGAYTVEVRDAQGCANQIAVEIANVGPAEPALSRPSPNPTRGALQFRYGTPAYGAFRLSVLDLQGREVALLAHGVQPAGWAWASWNGQTERGPAAAGMYFVCLQAGGRRIVHRFAMVR